MKYCLLKFNIVIQVQKFPATNFIQCPDYVQCGMVFDGTDYAYPPLTSSQSLKKRQRERILEMKGLANLEFQKLSKDLDYSSFKIIRWLWPAIDQSLVKPKLVTAVEIDRLLRVAIKAIRAATTVAEVDAVQEPVWP